jgi:hypothetical protein
MATIDFANYASLALAKGGVMWGQRRYDASNEAVPSGNVQTRLFGVPRWTLSLMSPQAVTEAEGIVWRELLLALRGRVNYLKIWNPAQTIIRGTMRGTQTLNGSHSAGAPTVNIIVTGTGEVGKTILSGSPITIGTGIGTSQLVHTIGDATAINTAGNSTIALTVEPPLRSAFIGGTAITYDKAFSYFKQTGNAARWRHYDSRLHQEFALDLLEAIN